MNSVKGIILNWKIKQALKDILLVRVEIYISSGVIVMAGSMNSHQVSLVIVIIENMKLSLKEDVIDSRIEPSSLTVLPFLMWMRIEKTGLSIILFVEEIEMI